VSALCGNTLSSRSRGALGEEYQKRWQNTLEGNAAALGALLKARFTCRVMRND